MDIISVDFSFYLELFDVIRCRLDLYGNIRSKLEIGFEVDSNFGEIIANSCLCLICSSNQDQILLVDL